MMKFGSLSILTKTNDPYTRIVVAWHNPKSITWLWALSFHKFKADEKRSGFAWSSSPHNCGRNSSFRVPFIGLIYFNQQKPMWRKDYP